MEPDTVAVMVAGLAKQTGVLVEMETDGVGFITAAADTDTVQPVAPVAVTVYVDAVELEILAVVAPVFHT